MLPAFGGGSKVVDHVMSFGLNLNVMSDTLPHRADLLKWKLISLDACPLCSERQTLSHSCPAAVNGRRFTKRKTFLAVTLSLQTFRVKPMSFLNTSPPQLP